MYKWLSPARGGKYWIYRDSEKGCGGLVWKDASGEYVATSPTERESGKGGIWLHDAWGSSSTLEGAKRIVENHVSRKN